MTAAAPQIRYVPDEDSLLMPQLIRERAARAEAGVQQLPAANGYDLTPEEAERGEMLRAACLWSRGVVPVCDRRTRDSAVVWVFGNIRPEHRPDAQEALDAYITWEMRLWGIEYEPA